MGFIATGFYFNRANLIFFGNKKIYFVIMALTFIKKSIVK